MYRTTKKKTYFFDSGRILSLDQTGVLVKAGVGLLKERIDHVDDASPLDLDIVDILQLGRRLSRHLGGRLEQPVDQAQHAIGGLVELVADGWADGALELEILVCDDAG